MTTVATSRKVVTSIMTLELLESTELDYIDFWCIYRADPEFLKMGFICIKVLGSLF